MDDIQTMDDVRASSFCKDCHGPLTARDLRHGFRTCEPCALERQERRWDSMTPSGGAAE